VYGRNTIRGKTAKIILGLNPYDICTSALIMTSFDDHSQNMVFYIVRSFVRWPSRLSKSGSRDKKNRVALMGHVHLSLYPWLGFSI